MVFLPVLVDMALIKFSVLRGLQGKIISRETDRQTERNRERQRDLVHI